MILQTCLILALISYPSLLVRADEPSPAATMINLLKANKLAPERLGNIVKLACQRGDATDLDYIFQRSLKADGFTPAVRLIALDGLVEAAQTRKVQPKGELSGLRELIKENKGIEPTVRLAALRLAGVWKVEAARRDLTELALAVGTETLLRESALDALVRLGGKETRSTIDQLIAADRPASQRLLGITALARVDPEAAAPRAAEVLAKLTEADNPAPLLAAFLDSKGAPEKLAAAVVKQKLPADTAKLSLRYLFSIGRADPALVDALSKAAGLDFNPKKLNPKEVNAIIQEVTTKGDPARGEKVFRRADLSCTKCHALNGAGGDVGPDLRAIGTSSPPDYILHAILDPDRDIKEEFLTVLITTKDGKLFQGIVAEENEARVVLKDATGVRKVIAKADIDEREKGKSLMPKGLDNFLTRSELLDLVRFLSELGKPSGEYAIKTEPTLRRWRLLDKPSAELLKEVPDDKTFREQILNAEPSRWSAAYSKVSGILPLDEIPTQQGAKVFYTQGELEVKTAGKMGLKLDSANGVHLWLDGDAIPVSDKIVLDLPMGRHKLTFRLDAAKHGSARLRADLTKLDDSDAEAAFVGGP